MSFTYRIGTPEDIPAIAELLATSGLNWPGPASTPYVAVDEQGVVAAVFFKTLCFHAEPLAARPNSGFSVTELGKVIRQSFEQLVDEMGYPITVYSMVQDTPAAHAAAIKNGLRRSAGVLYEITLHPTEPVGGEEHVPWGRGDGDGRDHKGASTNTDA